MGNAPSSSTATSVGVARRDRRWLGFGLHQLFQLSEDRALPKESTALANGSVTGLVGMGGVGGDFGAAPHHRDGARSGTPCAELVADEAVATTCLADVPPELAVRQTAAWLADGLGAACVQEDSFQKMVVQRLQILQCVHGAMQRTWPVGQSRNKRGAAASVEMALMQLVSAKCRREITLPRVRHNSRCSSSAPPLLPPASLYMPARRLNPI